LEVFSSAFGRGQKPAVAVPVLRQFGLRATEGA
jgi:hypothetical protein